MSWAEVKKSVNSNLQKPLNKLIDDEFQNSIYGLKSVIGKSTEGTITSDYFELLNITGKGNLINALVGLFLESDEDNHSQKGLLRITIDDKIILYLISDTTNTIPYYSYNIMGIMNIKSGVFYNYSFYPLIGCHTQNNNNVGTYMTNPIENIIGYQPGLKRSFVEFSNNLQRLIPNITNTDTDSHLTLQYLVPTARPIRFEKNCKIEIASGSDKMIKNYDYAITYTLDE